MTVLALAVAPGVDRVRLTFADRSRRTIFPQPLSTGAAKSGSRRPRYAVLAVPAHLCLTGMVSENTMGREVWAAAGDRCLPDLDQPVAQPANLGEPPVSPHT